MAGKKFIYGSSRMCASPGCDTLATFGREAGRATHCRQHSQPDMRDVKHRMCAFPGCEKRAIPKSTLCKKHHMEAERNDEKD